MSYTISEKLSIKQLLAFSLPAVFMFIFKSIYTIVDGIFVARFVSADALAALNIVVPVIFLFIAISMMFGTGGSALVGYYLGRGKKASANRAFTLITLFAFCLMTVLTILALIFDKEICTFLGADTTLLPYARDYFFILILFSPFNVLQTIFECFFVTANRPSLGFILNVIGGCLNIVFDYIFILHCELGISGAAYATVLSWVLTSIVGLIFFTRNKAGLTFQKPYLHFSILWKSMFNGLSEMIGQLSQAVTTFIFNILMMKFFGSVGVAAIGVALYCNFLMMSAFFGFSIGIAPIISYHFGAKNTEYLKETIKKLFFVVSCASVVVYFVCFFASPFIVSVFFKSGTEVYEVSQYGLSIYSLSFLFMGINIFASALFTALNNGFISGILAFYRTFLFLVITILVFSHFWQGEGLWYAVPVAEFLSILVVLYFTKTLKRQYKIL